MEGIIATKKQTIVQSNDIVIESGVAQSGAYTQVSSPVAASISTYYELENGYYQKSFVFDSLKTYYTKGTDSDVYTKVSSPSAENIDSYYELCGSYKKTNDTAVDSSKTYYQLSVGTGTGNVSFKKQFTSPPQIFYSVDGNSTDKIWMVKTMQNPAVTTSGFCFATCSVKNGSSEVTAGAASVNWVAIGT